MKLRYLLAAATCLGLPVAAHAQPVTGPYVSLSAGYNIPFNRNLTLGDEVVEDLTGGKSVNVPLSFTGGVAGIAGAGYGFGNGFRVELDGNYLHDNSNKLSIADEDVGSTKLPGTEQQYGAMVNGIYDLALPGWPVYPYFGGGVGVQFTNYRSKYIGLNGTGDNAAIDAIAGIAYPLPFVAGLSLTAQYTFMTTLGDVAVGKVNDGDGGVAKIGFDNNMTNIVTVGLRYQIFNAPSAPPMMAPAAAPAAAPAKTYLVFFDWDKYNLTPRATQIIAQAASDSHTQQVTTINVSGYTDTSGTAQYNQGLSQRRAKAVSAQLVADGVSQSEISIHAYGDTHLLVPTGPGVREPQNRRVEIVLN